MQRDELYNKAKKIVDETNKYSISYLQRKLQIGYNRASKIMQEIKKEFLLNEDKFLEKTKCFLEFFTKDELLQLLQNPLFISENELKFYIENENFKICIVDNQLVIMHLTYTKNKTLLDEVIFVSEDEVETKISKSEFLKILKG